MKIAICDDDTAFLSELADKIYLYSNQHNWESAIDRYHSGVELIAAKMKYDIVILDYQMDFLDGLETAKLLRKGLNQFSCIIFLTNFPDIAISAYDVDTYRFVVKNTLYEGLYRALDDFRNHKDKNYNISFKSDGDIITVNTEDIVFIESNDKEITVHLSDKRELITRKNLSALYKEVPHYLFRRIHKSIIVNMTYVQRQNSKSLKLKTYSFWLPISRKYSNSFKEAYLRFLKDQ